MLVVDVTQNSSLRWWGSRMLHSFLVHVTFRGMLSKGGGSILASLVACLQEGNGSQHAKLLSGQF